jgi:hypothetical protein
MPFVERAPPRPGLAAAARCREAAARCREAAARY